MGELFWACLPAYLAIGMSAEEFWHGEPRLAASYREAERMRRENRYLAEWRSGMYVQCAIAACLNKEASYPEEPLFAEPALAQARREERERASMERMRAQFEAMAARANQKVRERSEG